jgi:hypothetical protein
VGRDSLPYRTRPRLTAGGGAAVGPTAGQRPTPAMGCISLGAFGVLCWLNHSPATHPEPDFGATVYRCRSRLSMQVVAFAQLPCAGAFIYGLLNIQSLSTTPRRPLPRLPTYPVAPCSPCTTTPSRSDDGLVTGAGYVRNLSKKGKAEAMCSVLRSTWRTEGKPC